MNDSNNVALRLANCETKLEWCCYLSNLIKVNSIEDGISIVNDQEEFVLELSNNVGQLYKRQGQKAEFISWVPLGLDTSLGLINFFRNEKIRSNFEFDFGSILNGQFVANTGTKAEEAYKLPSIQLLGAARLMYDGDGVENGERIVWPISVLNSLNLPECVEVTFDSNTDEHYIIYLNSFNDLPSGEYTVAVSLKMDNPQPIILGSTHGSVGERITFTPTTDFETYSIDMSWGSGDFYSIAIRPDTSVATYPMSLKIERINIYPKNVLIPSLENERNLALAGHAIPAFAVDNQVEIIENGFSPSEKVSAFHVELDGSVVTAFRLSGYFNFNSQETAQSVVYPLGFSQESRPGDLNFKYGGIAYNLNSGEEYSNRLVGYAGSNTTSWPYVNMPDTILADFGEHRVDVINAGNGEEASQQSYNITGTSTRYRVFINAIEQVDIPASPVPESFSPKNLTIGGIQANAPKSSTTSAFFEGVIKRPRLDLNEDAANITYERIKQEFLRDIELGLVKPEPVTFSLITEGDSTSRFSGSPIHHIAKELAGTGRIFSNISQGGSYFYTNPGEPANNLNIFNRAGRIDMRKRVLDATVNVNNCPFTVYMWHGGENNVTHLENPELAYQQIKTMFVDGEAALFDNSNQKVIPVIVTVRPSGLNGYDGYANSIKRGFNNYLRTLFNVPTNCPYLFKSSNPSQTGFVYMIDLDAWAPRQRLEEGGVQFTDWYSCLEYGELATFSTITLAQNNGLSRMPMLGQYKITGPNPDEYYRHTGTNDPGGNSFAVTYANSETHYYVFEENAYVGSGVISPDNQHWAGTIGGVTAAQDVFVPAIREIANEYNINLN